MKIISSRFLSKTFMPQGKLILNSLQNLCSTNTLSPSVFGTDRKKANFKAGKLSRIADTYTQLRRWCVEFHFGDYG